MSRKNNKAKEKRRVAHYCKDEEDRINKKKEKNERRKKNAADRAAGIAIPGDMKKRRDNAKKPKVAPVVANKAMIEENTLKMEQMLKGMSLEQK